MNKYLNKEIRMTTAIFSSNGEDCFVISVDQKDPTIVAIKEELDKAKAEYRIWFPGTKEPVGLNKDRVNFMVDKVEGVLFITSVVRG